MKKIIGLVVSLTIISGVCAAVLAYVNSITADPIKATAEKAKEAAKLAVLCGMSATINLCRLRDGNPDAKEFARRRDAAVEQAFLLMAGKGGDASQSNEPDKGKDK